MREKWVENKNINLYLGEIDGTSVSTAATIRTGNTASLEFVSTLEEYRRRKVASVVCSRALADLFESGWMLRLVLVESLFICIKSLDFRVISIILS